MRRNAGTDAAPSNLFTDGDPESSTPASVLGSDWHNIIQEEVCEAIEAAGLTVDQANAYATNDKTQLTQAIQILAAAAGVAQAYIGTDPEVGGASPFTMTSAHKKSQVINPAGAITIRLPTTSILAGEVFTIKNRSVNAVLVQSSGANDIYSLNLGKIVLVALQNAPTSAAHWDILDVVDEISGTVGSSGNFTSGGVYKVSRSGKVVNLTISTAIAHGSSAAPASATGLIPAKFAPVYVPTSLTTWSGSLIQLISVATDGTLSMSYKDWAGSNSAQTTSIGGNSLTWVV